MGCHVFGCIHGGEGVDKDFEVLGEGFFIVVDELFWPGDEEVVSEKAYASYNQENYV